MPLSMYSQECCSHRNFAAISPWSLHHLVCPTAVSVSCLSVIMSVCLCTVVCILAVCQSVCLSVYFVYCMSFNWLSVSLSVCLFVRFWVSVSVYRFLFFSLFLCAHTCSLLSMFGSAIQVAQHAKCQVVECTSFCHVLMQSVFSSDSGHLETTSILHSTCAAKCQHGFLLN